MEGAAEISREILRSANRGLTRIEFLQEVSHLLLDCCDCDAIEVWLWKGDLHYRWVAAERPRTMTRFDLVRGRRGQREAYISQPHARTDLERLCAQIASQRFDSVAPPFTGHGSFWTSDSWEPFTLEPGGGWGATEGSLCIGGHHRSLAIAKFLVDEDSTGLLHLKREGPNGFVEADVELFEEVAQALGLGVAAWRAQAALRERIKELTCLYGIAQVIERPGSLLDETLRQIVRLLPPAWQYPHNAAARIMLDGRSSETPGFRQSEYRLSADVSVAGRRRGQVEVAYLDEIPEFAAGVFLSEEQKLIEEVARQLAVISEHREAETQKLALQQQLTHADRLATIGQLAAGVAHELNEPLGSILGFAQLAMKCSGLPPQARRDMEKIITASLYAREVIRKLMVFARQVPAQEMPVDLSEVVEEGLYFLDARCANAGVQVVRDLAPQLPKITADPAQLKQVLVNLVVNATQAMPEGGTLTVATAATVSSVVLEVRDTGIGMSPEVQARVFLPFFTTKDVSEGTGLGLAVVHGIVTTHGGSIGLQSQPGRGTRFEIRLPVAPAGEAEEAAHCDGRD